MSGADDSDVWNLYAKGVKKLGEKEAQKENKPNKAPQRESLIRDPVTAAPSTCHSGAIFSSLCEEKMESGTPFVSFDSEEKKTNGIPDRRAAASGMTKEPISPRQWKKEPLDLRVERNLSLGDVVIEARLDLHGQTEQAAYEKFREFVEAQHARGKRMLLVITGKGADGTSVLRANLPRWCDVTPFEDFVLAVRTAAPHHGGDGAYYVLLRKKGV